MGKVRRDASGTLSGIILVVRVNDTRAFVYSNTRFHASTTPLLSVTTTSRALPCERLLLAQELALCHTQLRHLLLITAVNLLDDPAQKERRSRDDREGRRDEEKEYV